MSVPAQPCRLTGVSTLGKTGTRRCSEHVMTTQPTRAASPALAGARRGAPVDVLRWRASRLRDAGFPVGLADTLSRERVDLHALLGLVDRGCPPDLAARILAPDDTFAGPR